MESNARFGVLLLLGLGGCQPRERQPTEHVGRVTAGSVAPSISSAVPSKAALYPPPYLVRLEPNAPPQQAVRAAGAPTARPSLPFLFPLSCQLDAQCFGYRCDAATHSCLTRCASGADCAAGATCAGSGLCTLAAGRLPPATTASPLPTLSLPLPWTGLPALPAPSVGKPPAPLPSATKPAPTVSAPPTAPSKPPPMTPPAVATDYDWKAHVKHTAVPEVAWTGDDGGSAFFRDVMTHATERFEGDPSLGTIGHETTHMITSKWANATPARDNFFYWGGGLGVYVVEPQYDAAHVRDYLPEGAKKIAASRYQLYLVDQTGAWKVVLYQFNEWNAYINGGRVGVEQMRAGKWPNPQIHTDVVDGMMDFLYFGSAAALALHDNERAYFDGDEAFKALYARNAEETVKLVNEGLGYPQFADFHASELRTHFVSSPENEKIRAMLREWYGSAWTKRVFGF